MLDQIKDVKTLENALYRWSNKFPATPIICREFDAALYNLVNFVRISLEAYGAESERFGSHIKEENKKLRKKKSSISLYSQKSDNMAVNIIPELYSLCLIGAWGLLEDFLRDAIFLSIENNIVRIKPKKGSGVKKIRIQKGELASLALERSRQNINELAKVYSILLNINLNENENFSKLLKLRSNRNVIAHSGTLFGYNSITNAVSVKKFTDELFSIQSNTGMEFINQEPIIDEKGEKTMPESWYFYDPTKTNTSKELEEKFCNVISNIWKVGKFVSDSLFLRKSIYQI